MSSRHHQEHDQFRARRGLGRLGGRGFGLSAGEGTEDHQNYEYRCEARNSARHNSRFANHARPASQIRRAVYHGPGLRSMNPESIDRPAATNDTITRPCASSKRHN